MKSFKVAGGRAYDFGAFKLYVFTTAITGGVTATTAAAGSLGKTSHATGRASLFVSNGTVWNFLTNA